MLQETTGNGERPVKGSDILDAVIVVEAVCVGGGR